MGSFKIKIEPYFWDIMEKRIAKLHKETKEKLKKKVYQHDVIKEWVYDFIKVDFDHKLIPIAVKFAKLTHVRPFLVTTFTKDGINIQTIKVIGYTHDIYKFTRLMDYFAEMLPESRKQITTQLRRWKRRTALKDPERYAKIPNARHLTKQFYTIEYKIFKHNLNTILAAYRKSPYKSLLSNKYQKIDYHIRESRIKDEPLTIESYERYRSYFNEDKGTPGIERNFGKHI